MELSFVIVLGPGGRFGSFEIFLFASERRLACDDATLRRFGINGAEPGNRSQQQSGEESKGGFHRNLKGSKVATGRFALADAPCRLQVSLHAHHLR